MASVFQPGYKALVAYVTAGYPDIKDTVRIARVLADNGCDIIELGIPFSDPLADGATIQKASYQALQHGVTPEACLETAAEIRGMISLPLVFMTYYNPVYYYGLPAFCRNCVDSGIDGLIVPDLPPDEGDELSKVTDDNNLDLIYLLPPNSTGERIKLVTDKSKGFVYLVSLTGVTGARDALPVELEEFVKKVRSNTDKPLCVGFGVSTPEHARRIANIADGVIVGSRIVQLIDEDSTLKSLGVFISVLRQALDTENNREER
ncbi:MAG: tryptophan synthase subunit alpha [Dehalococcoidia bacterium]